MLRSHDYSGSSYELVGSDSPDPIYEILTPKAKPVRNNNPAKPNKGSRPCQTKPIYSTSSSSDDSDFLTPQVWLTYFLTTACPRIFAWSL